VRRPAYGTSYRATALQVLCAFDVVARAAERTYHDPGRLNRQASRAFPVASPVTEMRR
jgi:hypothetical protein